MGCMDPARLRLIVPDDSAAVARLEAALCAQRDPPISVGHDAVAVLAVECATADLMLRSRVMRALEETYGRDWPRWVETIG